MVHLKMSEGGVEYVDIIQRSSDIKTVGEAVMAAQDLQPRLLERVKLYLDQETGHKLISVKPTYTITTKTCSE